jgi:uncharacterized protein (TIGR03435 family)
MKTTLPTRTTPTQARAALAGIASTVLLASSTILAGTLPAQQLIFAVATIRPSAAAVQFERDGKTETTPGTLRMRDVTVNTCIKWAYGVQDNQISGPDWVHSDRFDIIAKADEPANDDQMKLMLQRLLTDRFKLALHHQDKELKAFALTIAKGGPKLHPSLSDGPANRQNTANGMVAKSISMREFANFISGPLQTPVVDETGLPGKYDFTIDFTPYLPEDTRTRPDTTSVIMSALQGELGLKLESRKTSVDVLIIDHAEQPSAN